MFLVPVLVIVASMTASASASAVAQDDVRAKAMYAQAVDLEKQARFAEALPLLWEAAQLSPKEAEVQNRLGEALERIGALDAAAEAYRRAVADDKGFRKATNHLILVLAKGGKSSEALALARAEVAAAPADADRVFTLGLAQAEYNLDDAIETFRRVLVIAPRHTLARYNLALTLKRADRPAEAAAELERLIAIEPRAEAQYQLGVIAWQQGQLDRAIAALRAAIAVRADYAEAFYALGAVLKASGDLSAAAASLRQAIALMAPSAVSATTSASASPPMPGAATPSVSGAHYVLSQVLRQMGDDAGGRRELAESERLRQQFEAEHEASVLTFLGIQKLQAGDAMAAVGYLQQATATYEAYAQAHYQLGLAFQRLQKPAEARAAFSRARQLNPALIPPPEGH